ncbi:putative ZDHHC-type palmitoyltransferase 2 [Ostrea edulis]|uniref:putative ZDHHC-type palmitoyltransferase 2 n=1 Tax=Ostrea edulis TaxID=37623 RepID=UPI0024AF7B55|nr:putative ZDHHC-type palmitoyltransferase 2 [Ostrea edulis]
MAVSRAVKLDIQDQNEEPVTLMDKLRQHYEHRKQTGQRTRYTMYMCWALWIFQIPTQWYIAHIYLFPYLLHQFTEQTQFYVQVIYFICGTETVINLLCSMCFSSKYVKSGDNHELQGIKDHGRNPSDQFLQLNDTTNGHLPDDGGLPWSYCDKCDIMIPPRAHHCKICDACILKRDHHCFVVGRCIGHYNQRYFVVLTFYATIIGMGGAILTLSYLHLFYWPDATWTDFVLPVTLYRGLFGTMKCHIAIMIVHMYTEIAIGILGMVFFPYQMYTIYKGVTVYEIMKGVSVLNTNSANANFASVFGNFWALNFVFPMTVLCRQQEDGTSWRGVKLNYSTKIPK